MLPGVPFLSHHRSRSIQVSPFSETRTSKRLIALWSRMSPLLTRDPDAAREQYERVLAIEPDHAWVRDFLLPDLDR